MGSCCSPSSAALQPPGQGTVTTVTDAQATTPGILPQQPQGEYKKIPSGSFSMGDHWGDGYSRDGEVPVHDVKLEGFSMGATTVTNAQFELFVQDTGYRTTAEQFGMSAVFYAAFQGRRADIINQVPGVPWWLAVRGANWMHPDGPASGLPEREDHPVVHVSWQDAATYCQWAGTRLPTEAEWEYAARGGLGGKRMVWGDDLTPHGQWHCNIWQGRFPHENSAEDGYLTTAPVRTYQPNGYGLWQMAGNIWEWCQDWFDPDYYSSAPPVDPRGPKSGTHRVLRGGSYLCHDSYCNRYRVAARSNNTPESTAGNIGFRVVADSKAEL